MTKSRAACLTVLGIALSLSTVASPSAAASVDDTMLKRGQLLSIRCTSCHEYAVGRPHKVGPNLNGIFGRKAGSAAGYNYSAAMGTSTRIWTNATMDQWLEKPTAVIPGTKMAFVGLPKAEDRLALTAWLRKATR